MRHRIVSEFTGLGNPAPEILNNKGLESKHKPMIEEAIDLWFKELGGCDFSVQGNEILIGIEPAYQYERLKVISINRIKFLSYIKTGIAWGSWGSQLVTTKRVYKDYKKTSKFVKFIDKWHSQIFSIDTTASVC